MVEILEKLLLKLYINKIIGNEHPVAQRLQTKRVNVKKPLAAKTDWQEIENLPGQNIKEKFQKKLVTTRFYQIF